MQMGIIYLYIIHILNSRMSEGSTQKSSLKGKALSLEKLIYEIQMQMEAHRKNVSAMQDEHVGGSTYNAIECKSKKIKSTLEMELEQIESKLKLYISARKTDNQRLWAEIAGIKNERSYLQKYLGVIGTRISEIEGRLGIEG